MPDSKLILSGGGTPPPRQDAEPEYNWQHHGSVHSRIIDVDPVFKKTTTYWYDDNDNTQWTTETWDIKDILEQNKALRNMTDENARWTPRRDGGEMQWTHAFTVPMALVPDLWKKTNYGKDRREVSKWLMADENKQFLVRNVKVGL